jgi:hypothetical protein
VGDVSRSVDHAGALGQRRVRGDRLGGFVHPDAFASQGRLVRAQAVCLDQARIRRHFLAMRQHQDVAGDDFGSIDPLMDSSAKDGGLEHQQLIQGFELLLGAILLEEAQTHAQDNNARMAAKSRTKMK